MKRKHSSLSLTPDPDVTQRPSVNFSPQDVKCYDCATPRFKKGQTVLNATGMYRLPENKNCVVIVVKNVLSQDDRDLYVQNAASVTRVVGASGFGPKPRAEVCYTVSGDSYVYSGKKHYTTKFPDHVKTLIPKILSACESFLPHANEFTVLSHAVDIIYSDAFPRGGSISAHKDDEMPWGLVLVYSLGQTRWMRVRHVDSGKYYNIELSDNSVVAMYGAEFQKDYTHQVDKLSPSEPVHARLSLNVRFLPKDDESSDLRCNETVQQ